MLLIIRGLPGSGKSTLAKNLILTSPDMNYQHFEADMYHINEEGEYIFKPSKIKDAHAWCFDNVKKTLESGGNVIVSNTFTTNAEMMNYIYLAKELKVPFEIIECFAEYGSIHNVPEETMKRMKARWEPVNRMLFGDPDLTRMVLRHEYH